MSACSSLMSAGKTVRSQVFASSIFINLQCRPLRRTSILAPLFVTTGASENLETYNIHLMRILKEAGGAITATLSDVEVPTVVAIDAGDIKTPPAVAARQLAALVTKRKLLAHAELRGYIMLVLALVTPGTLAIQVIEVAEVAAVRSRFVVDRSESHGICRWETLINSLVDCIQ